MKIEDAVRLVEERAGAAREGGAELVTAERYVALAAEVPLGDGSELFRVAAVISNRYPLMVTHQCWMWGFVVGAVWAAHLAEEDEVG